MRTEQDLRSALDHLADTAPDPRLVLGRLQLESPRRSVRPSRALVPAVLAIVVALVVAAVAIPLVLARRADVADLRQVGYWGFVATVDPPPGWRLERHGIEGDRESLGLRRMDATADCAAVVYGRGDYRGPTSSADGTEVAGEPASFLAGTASEPARLVWSYAENAWALVSCSDTTDRTVLVQIAEAVRFQRSTAKLPFRFSTMPDGYAASSLVVAEVDGQQSGLVTLTGPNRVTLQVYSTPQRLPDPGPGLPGIERATVGGRSVVFREDRHAAQMDGNGGYVVIVGTGGSTTATSWAAGEKEAISQTLERLQVSDQLDQPRTWYDARRALRR